MNNLVKLANIEPKAVITGLKTNALYEVNEFMFGVLVPDESHPLSSVSINNNAISIDIWKGCSFKCAYCHVQGAKQDLCKKTQKMPLKPKLRGGFSVQEVIDALEQHPFFIPNKSVISIGTSSTEPFARGEVLRSTIQIIEEFLTRGYTNPFWVVTKAGIPFEFIPTIEKLKTKGSNILISLCYAANVKKVEPVSNNRFLNAREAKKAGAMIAWYMRPLVPEWGGDIDNIKNIIKEISLRFADVIDIITPGGLRWTEGIEYGLKEVYTVPDVKLSKGDREKTLNDEMFERIKSLCAEHFPNVPIYKKSSCMISYFLNMPNINFVQDFSMKPCNCSICPESQRSLCSTTSIKSLTKQQVQSELNSLMIDCKVIDVNNGEIKTSPDINKMTYAVYQTFIKKLAGV